MTAIDCDLCIVGSGIAGVSLAARLAPYQSVVLLEQEAHPAYHATGRSVAIFTQALSGKQVGPLTRASRAFFEAPPVGFSEIALSKPRPVLQFGDADQRDELVALDAELRRDGGRSHWLEGDAVQDLVPILRSSHAAAGVLDEDAFEIDVDALFQAWLRQARSAGAHLFTNVPLLRAEPIVEGWRLDAGDRAIHTRILVNAAGAWGDEVARIAGVVPLGLSPRRRTVAVLPTDKFDVERWPMCVAARHDLYFKPDAGRLLVSAMEEMPSAPCDAMVDDLDVAIALDRLEEITGLTPRRPLRTWAGLRTFSPDGEPVAGFDPDHAGFFWLVGQGGTGIQTAPALSEAAAALLRRMPISETLAAFGVSASALAPARLRTPLVD